MTTDTSWAPYSYSRWLNDCAISASRMPDGTWHAVGHRLHAPEDQLDECAGSAAMAMQIAEAWARPEQPSAEVLDRIWAAIRTTAQSPA